MQNGAGGATERKRAGDESEGPHLCRRVDAGRYQRFIRTCPERTLYSVCLAILIDEKRCDAATSLQQCAGVVPWRHGDGGRQSVGDGCGRSGRADTGPGNAGAPLCLGTASFYTTGQPVFMSSRFLGDHGPEPKKARASVTRSDRNKRPRARLQAGACLQSWRRVHSSWTPIIYATQPHRELARPFHPGSA
jgi:hypothetical protein